MLSEDDLTPAGEGAVSIPHHRRISAEWQSISTADLDRLVHAAFGAHAFNLRRTIAKFFRYGATSIVAFGISEIVLLVVAALGVTATLAAAIGTISGVIPSYLLSRYWIWAEASRDRAARQVVLYWLISAVALVVTSFTTGGVADIAPSTGPLHLVAVGAGFLVINAVCFVGKYLIYQRFVFLTHNAAPSREAAPARRGASSRIPVAAQRQGDDAAGR